MLFGPVLKTRRLVAGLSQDDMAEKTHLSRSTVSRLENDKMELKAADLVRWLQVTQLPEATAAVICGVDIVALTQMLTTLVGGFISFLF